MHPIVWWAATAVVFFTLELTTASFFFLWIGLGATLTAALSFFTDASWIQYLSFACSSMLLVTLSRPWAKRLSGPTKRPSNVDSLVGQTALVVRAGPQLGKGEVKVEGAIWNAESQDQKAFPKEGKVEIVSVQGNVLVVRVQ